ncbi:MAG: FtsW/RodA/SpoVE family cell cycle protein [Lachnospiraceae bacterium]|nr:FtsW/RodA/SpoVE family cell cycle protein [Lachnospiraceae bacterium]MBQ7864011.1 FtsW/RodA/SpoVE family cell cycle protein [Lachnospiraceae bacterium]
MFKKLQEYDFRKFDLGMLIATIILGAIGAFLLRVIPGVTNPESAYLKQLLGVFFGVCLAIFVALFDYHFVAKFFVPLYMINLVFLLMVKFTKFGMGVYGTKRWLGIENVFSFQPSELTKVIMIIVMAKMFDLLKERLHKFSTLIIVGIIMGIPTFLVLIQTDLSTAIVLFGSFIVMVFASGYSIKILAVLTAVAVPTVYGLFWYILQPDNLLIEYEIMKPYQQDRILSLINPEDYPELLYQQENAVEAMSSGGLMGKTLTGDTGVRGTAYVPVVESDFIFTGIGEEFGFLGAAIVILLFTFLVFRIMLIARRATDVMGKVIATGAAAILMLQTFINIGVVSMILPNTGIPLPFVSNGLSSVVGCYSMLGLVLNIAINTGKKRVPEKKLF